MEINRRPKLNTYTKHIAGSYDEETKLQICSRCGSVIIDYNGVVWLGDAPPEGFKEGKEVYISSDGSFKTTKVSPETETVDCLHVKMQITDIVIESGMYQENYNVFGEPLKPEVSDKSDKKHPPDSGNMSK